MGSVYHYRTAYYGTGAGRLHERLTPQFWAQRNQETVAAAPPDTPPAPPSRAVTYDLRGRGGRPHAGRRFGLPRWLTPHAR